MSVSSLLLLLYETLEVGGGGGDGVIIFAGDVTRAFIKNIMRIAETINKKS
jgi:hypothetical protein